MKRLLALFTVVSILGTGCFGEEQKPATTSKAQTGKTDGKKEDKKDDGAAIEPAGEGRLAKFFKPASIATTVVGGLCTAYMAQNIAYVNLASTWNDEDKNKAGFKKFANVINGNAGLGTFKNVDNNRIDKKGYAWRIGLTTLCAGLTAAGSFAVAAPEKAKNLVGLNK